MLLACNTLDFVQKHQFSHYQKDYDDCNDDHDLCDSNLNYRWYYFFQFAIQPQIDLTIFSEILTQPTSPKERQYGYTTGW